MFFSGTPISNENKNPLTPVPNFVAHSSEESPLSTRSRNKRASIHGSASVKSPSPLSPKRIDFSSKHNDFNLKDPSSLTDETVLEQDIQKLGKYFSIVHSKFKKESESKKDIIGRLNKEMNTVKYDNETLLSALQGKENTISQLTMDKQEFQAEVNRLEQKLMLAHERISEYQKREEGFKVVQREYEDVRLAYEKCNDQVKTQEREISSLKSQALNRDEEIKQKEFTVQCFTQQFSNLKQSHELEISRLTKELDAVKSDNTYLENKCTTVRDKTNVLLAEFEQNKTFLDAAEKKLHLQELAIQRLMDDHEIMARSLQNEKSKLTSELKHVQDALKHVQADFEGATQQILQQEKKFTELVVLNESLNDEVSRLSELFEQTESSSRAYIQRIEKLQSALNEEEKLKLALKNDLNASRSEVLTKASDLHEANAQLTKSQSQLEDSQNQCRSLEGRIRHLMDGHEKSETEFLGRISELESHLRTLETQLKLSDSTHAQLHHQMNALTAQNDSLTNELEAVTQKLRQVETDQNATLKKWEETKHQLESVTKQRDSQDSSAKLLRQQLVSTQEFLQKTEVNFKLQLQEFDSLRQEKLNVETELESVKASYAAFNVQYQKATDLYKNAQSSEESIQSKLKHKVLELEQSQNQASTLRKQLTEAQQQISELARSQAEAALLQTQLADVQQKYFELEHYQDEATSLQKQLADLQDKLSELENSQAEAKALRKQLADLQVKYAELEPYQDEANSLRKQLSDFQQTFSDLERSQAEAKALRMQLADVQLKYAELEPYQEEASALRKQLSEFQQTISRLERSQDEAKALREQLVDVRQMLSELEPYQEEANSMRKQLSDFQQTISQLERSQNEANALRQQLTDLQQKMLEVESLEKESNATSTGLEDKLIELANALECKTQEYEKERNSLQISISTQKSIAKHLASEKDQLETRLHTLRIEFSKLQDTNDHLLEDNRKQSLLLQSAEQQYEAIQEKCHALQTHCATLETKCSNQTKSVKDNEEVMSKRFAQEKNGWEAKLATVLLAKDALSAEYAEMRTSNMGKMTALEKENAALKEKLAKNTATLEDLHSQLSSKSVLLHRYHVQSAETKEQYEQELERKRSQLKTQQQTIVNLTKSVECLKTAAERSHANESAEELDEPEATDSELRRKFERLQSRNRTLESEVQELRDAVMQMSENSITQQCQALEKELSILRMEHEMLLKENRQMNAKLDAQHDLLAQNSDLSMQVSMLDEINSNLVGHQNQKQKIRYLARLKDEASRLREQLATATKERDQLHLKVTDLEDELSALRSVEQTNGKKRLRMDHITLPTPNFKQGF